MEDIRSMGQVELVCDDGTLFSMRDAGRLVAAFVWAGIKKTMTIVCVAIRARQRDRTDLLYVLYVQSGFRVYE